MHEIHVLWHLYAYLSPAMVGEETIICPKSEHREISRNSSKRLVAGVLILQMKKRSQFYCLEKNQFGKDVPFPSHWNMEPPFWTWNRRLSEHFLFSAAEEQVSSLAETGKDVVVPDVPGKRARENHLNREKISTVKFLRLLFRGTFVACRYRYKMPWFLGNIVSVNFPLMRATPPRNDWGTFPKALFPKTYFWYEFHPLIVTFTQSKWVLMESIPKRLRVQHPSLLESGANTSKAAERDQQLFLKHRDLGQQSLLQRNQECWDWSLELRVPNGNVRCAAKNSALENFSTRRIRSFQTRTVITCLSSKFTTVPNGLKNRNAKSANSCRVSMISGSALFPEMSPRCFASAKWGAYHALRNILKRSFFRRFERCSLGTKKHGECFSAGNIFEGRKFPWASPWIMPSSFPFEQWERTILQRVRREMGKRKPLLHFCSSRKQNNLEELASRVMVASGRKEPSEIH